MTLELDQSGTKETPTRRTTPPLLFLDTETCGLELSDPIWEVGAIRREQDGVSREYAHFVQHDVRTAAGLPGAFRADHLKRYDPHTALEHGDMRLLLEQLLQPAEDGARVHIVGANPGFDIDRVHFQLGVRTRGYYLVDIRTLAVGYLAGIGRVLPPPWSSDTLSLEIGVDPTQFRRHTALGDARWARAVFDRITTVEG